MSDPAGAAPQAGTILHAGTAVGPVLRLDEPLSFWGGFDPVTGAIIDRSHPQAGLSIAGRVLALPGSRGSAGTPAGVAESLRRGSGPAAMLLARPDVNIAVGAMVAARLYAVRIPVLVLDPATHAAVAGYGTVAITADGSIRAAS